MVVNGVKSTPRRRKLDWSSKSLWWISKRNAILAPLALSKDRNYPKKARDNTAVNEGIKTPLTGPILVGTIKGSSKVEMC